jgi:hypothetical protein
MAPVGSPPDSSWRTPAAGPSSEHFATVRAVDLTVQFVEQGAAIRAHVKLLVAAPVLIEFGILRVFILVKHVTHLRAAFWQSGVGEFVSSSPGQYTELCATLCFTTDEPMSFESAV